ncbi:MAG: leucine dehydrogenase [Myxococcales bacterium]|nr:leucine dehydrogenase [Myxococcales bacterium]
MEVFDQLDRHGYGELHLSLDRATGLRAIVAIHDVRLGPALGGCRFVSYPDEPAAIIDAMRLARAMTAKAALARLPHGGGKAVIMRPEGDDFDRAALFQSFGRFVDTLGGRYLTTEDSGTSTGDIAEVRKHTRHACGFTGEAGGSGDPSPLTALGVCRGIEACVKHRLGRDSLQGLRVAVQGVGNVGGHLCRELASRGAKLVIADVHAQRCADLSEALGAEIAEVSAIHRVECDVFAPCALGGAINARSVPELRCAIVAGAANNQLESDADGQALAERGILLAPDYAINAGGLINVALEVSGYDPDRARERTLAIYDTILEICERADQVGERPDRIADAMVAEILAAAA